MVCIRFVFQTKEGGVKKHHGFVLFFNKKQFSGWQSLANQINDEIEMLNHRNRKGYGLVS